MTHRNNPADTPALTRAQVKVLRQICQGKQTKDIALALGLSKRTVDFHIRGIYQRLGISNRVQAMQRARELGLLAQPTSAQPDTPVE